MWHLQPVVCLRGTSRSTEESLAKSFLLSLRTYGGACFPVCLPDRMKTSINVRHWLHYPEPANENTGHLPWPKRSLLISLAGEARVKRFKQRSVSNCVTDVWGEKNPKASPSWIPSSLWNHCQICSVISFHQGRAGLTNSQPEICCFFWERL